MRDFAKVLFNMLADQWHRRRAPHHDDVFDVVAAHFVCSQKAPANLETALDQRQRKPVEFLPGKVDAEVEFPTTVQKRRKGRNCRNLLTREFDFRLFAEAEQRADNRIFTAAVLAIGLWQRHAALANFGDKPIVNRAVEIAPAKIVVAIVSDNAQKAIVFLEERDVERTAAKVVDEPTPT